MRKIIEKFKIAHNNKYDYSKVQYKNNHTKITIICPKHGEFKQRPKDHLKCGCIKCGYELLSKLNKKSQHQFIQEATLIHNNKYDYSKVQYKNNHTKITIICPKHGEFKQLPSNHLMAHGCYQCCFEHTSSMFIQKVKYIHNKYDYSKTDYKNHKTKIIIICPEHGEFKQRPKDHLAGSGCPKCGSIAIQEKLRVSSIEFFNRCKLVHNNKYQYASAYVGHFFKITIICPEHGKFEQLATNHVRGSECPICSLNKRKLSISEIKNRIATIHNQQYEYKFNNYKNISSKIEIKCNNHGWFEQRTDDHLNGHGCPQCFHPTSAGEKEIYNLIKSICNNQIIENSRKIIWPYELDIFIPSHKLAIEYDGVRWHSYNKNETKKEIYKHYNKHELCTDIGINLIQIWESEWINKKNIIVSMIKLKLGLASKIHARKCKIKPISNYYFDKFMMDNHLQGIVGTKYKFGLFYGDKLLQAIGFNKHMTYEYEITRMASKCGVVVVGGVSKLFAYFLKTYKPKSIITFANARYSVGTIYTTLGFKLVKRTKPGYYYTKGQKIYSRIKFQKHKLQHKLILFDPLKTEAENMFANNYRRLWDSGNYKFIWVRDCK